MPNPAVSMRINAEGPNKRLQDIFRDITPATEEEADAACWALQVELAFEVHLGLRSGFFVRATLSRHQPGKPR